jgi:hypothetical protein
VTGVRLRANKVERLVGLGAGSERVADWQLDTATCECSSALIVTYKKNEVKTYKQ